MKWKNIQDEQPAHDEEIVQCNPLGDGDYIMGIRKYYQTVSWQDLIEYYKNNDLPTLDFFWISAKDFPFPTESKNEN